MKIAIVCDTAYQVLNALSLTNEFVQDAENSVDLFIGHQFVNSRKIAEQIQKENICTAVYGFVPKKQAAGMVGKVKRVFEIIDNEKSVLGQLEEAVDVKAKQYDAIFMSLPSHFATSLTFMFPKAKVYYFDDGIGSYNGSIGINCIAKMNQIIYRLLGKNLNQLKPEVVYLNNPGFSRNLDQELRQIPALTNATSQFWDMISRIWSYEDDGYYRNHKVLYLTQPSDGDVTYDEVHDLMVELLDPYSETCLLRPHPRQTDVNSGSMEIDNHRAMWELVCAGQITDEHLLISHYSTSQILPKIIYNKEPVLVFCYKMAVSKSTSIDTTEMDDVVQRLREAYSDPSKIYVPETREEMVMVLQKTINVESRK